MKPLNLLFVLLGITFLFCHGCKTEDRSKTDSMTVAEKRHPLYPGWKTFQSENIRIYYPEGHPQEKNFESFSKGYHFALNRITKELEIPPYTDTILIYWYTGFGQGRVMTGQEYPFYDSVIHLWLPSFPGPTLMQLLLPQWSPPPPRHKFLYHGLIALYDFSGQDYHWATVDYKTNNNFIPLQRLAIDTMTDHNLERHQTAHAASFAAFVLATYGSQTLKLLYQSELPIDQAVQEIIGSDIETIENSWLDFAQATARPPEEPSVSP